MPVLTEPPSMGDVLKYEVNPNYTREVITLLAGMPYPVGSVLGKITASGKYTLSPATGADGSQVATAVLLMPSMPRWLMPWVSSSCADLDRLARPRLRRDGR